MAEKLVVKEPIFIEEEGRPVAVLLPIEQFRAWQGRLQADVPFPEIESVKPLRGFEREKAAFERMKPDLMKQVPGKCVAVVGEQVVEIGEDKIEVIEKVHKRFGHVPMYVQWVTEQPRVYHFPYRRVSKA